MDACLGWLVGWCLPPPPPGFLWQLRIMHPTKTVSFFFPGTHSSVGKAFGVLLCQKKTLTFGKNSFKVCSIEKKTSFD